MTLNKGKHIIAELEGVRCTVVESKITGERVKFLKDILEYNGFEVKVQQEAADTEGAAPTFTLGVTDIVFNPVVAVYQKRLKLKNGNRVTPAYWNQWGEPQNVPYWLIGRI